MLTDAAGRSGEPAVRIAYLNPTGQMGGAERALVDLMASVRAARPDWQLRLITGSEGDLPGEARQLGVQASVLPFPARLARLGDAGAGGPAGNEQRLPAVIAGLLGASPGTASYVRRLKRELGEFAPDLVHTNGFKMHVLGVWAAPAQAPVVWHVHDFVQARPVMSRLLRIHARRCAAVIANSMSVASDVRAALGERPRVTTVYNAVDMNRFSPSGARLDLDRIAGMPPPAEGTVRVGLLATMARWKGHEVFLRAFATVAAKLPVRGYVIGGPLYESAGSQSSAAELARLAARIGIADRVGFTGFVPDAAAAMRALDIVVHASTAPEPFGLVIAEAMACGKPVVASAAGGAAEIVTDGVNALTHPPGDAAALALRIGELAADASLRERLGAAASVTARERFTRSRLAAELIPLYRELAGVAA